VAVAAGRKLGRRPAPLLTPEQDELARQLQATGRSVTEIADLIGVSRAKLYRAMPPDRATSTGEDSPP
jgi:DNA invertase Pin-like site-specific DNA recombinase